ncbi:cell envelope integrity protein TolA [Caenimonas soli]|uniref:cell envelope integrity protein TolA n=1 Tax=Caenimonas soli TaxID=2735555 RepID=UPI00155677D7|nr:cell envelope integrity protein TolA [Caenimonas soli]NPC56726.1 cell envelope integrity protein TolA [Caenimonas soli]
MHDSADRLDFAPPPEPAAIRAFVLAILAHVLLMIALTWGINWNRDAENVAAEAELWSSVPQQAAPKVVTAPPLPTPPPPKPEPKPEPKVEPPPAPPVSKAPDIALEREKKRRELAERRQEELERQKKLEARKKQEELKRQEEIAEQKAEEEKKKKKAEELAKAKEKQEAAKAKQDEAKMAALRKENMERMMKGAAGTGPPSATGTAARSSGPSDSYAGRIRARVKPNIVFTDDIAGNPTAEVEVRLAPDGTITGKRVVKSSGAKSWDEAVLRALDKTEILPRDVDGRVHSPLIIEFRPKG